MHHCTPLTHPTHALRAHAGTRGELTTHEFFTLLYLLDLYSVTGSVRKELPSGVFPPAVHLCYQAAGLAVPVSLQPSTVAHVPLAEQNPVENLALQAEGTGRTLLLIDASFCCGELVQATMWRLLLQRCEVCFFKVLAMPHPALPASALCRKTLFHHPGTDPSAHRAFQHRACRPQGPEVGHAAARAAGGGPPRGHAPRAPQSHLRGARGRPVRCQSAAARREHGEDCAAEQPERSATA